MIDDKSLKFITSIDNVEVYEFKATLFHYFYTHMAYYERLHTRMIRETLDYLRGGYHVIYFSKCDELIGYGTVVKGGGRYKFATSKDIVCCNIWVQPEHRGNGYSTLIYRILTENIGITYHKANAFIRHDNIPSVKAAENAGFKLTGNAEHRGLLSAVVRTEEGHLGIYEKLFQGA